MRWLTKFVDSRTPGSFAARLRQQRFRVFEELIEELPRPLRILDVGGLEGFWERTGLLDDPGVHVVLLNLTAPRPKRPNVVAVVGDARQPFCFKDQQFDIVFSNSVIEHLADWPHQQNMAREILRVGRRYFVQTPNRNFPIEPHFALPFFQFLPLTWRVWLIRHFNISWYKRMPDPSKAFAFMRVFRLLTRGEMRQLFPNATLFEEKILGLTKSFVAYGGWSK
jgi:SAM-dependent methyltransferase